MSSVGSVPSSASQSPALAAPNVQVVQTASQVDAATKAQLDSLGLPRAGLAQAAATNTVNSELASSEYGIDPSLVSGVYGGGSSGGLFSGVDMLPVLNALTHSTAERALALMGVQTPTPKSSQTDAATASGDAPASGSSTSVPLPVTTDSGENGMLVDPLFGTSA